MIVCYYTKVHFKPSELLVQLGLNSIRIGGISNACCWICVLFHSYYIDEVDALLSMSVFAFFYGHSNWFLVFGSTLLLTLFDRSSCLILSILYRLQVWLLVLGAVCLCILAFFLFPFLRMSLLYIWMAKRMNKIYWFFDNNSNIKNLPWKKSEISHFEINRIPFFRQIISCLLYFYKMSFCRFVCIEPFINVKCKLFEIGSFLTNKPFSKIASLFQLSRASQIVWKYANELLTFHQKPEERYAHELIIIPKWMLLLFLGTCWPYLYQCKCQCMIHINVNIFKWNHNFLDHYSNTQTINILQTIHIRYENALHAHWQWQKALGFEFSYLFFSRLTLTLCCCLLFFFCQAMRKA